MLDGLEFYDFATERRMCCKTLEGDLWLCFKHPDGQWVTQRKATEDDVQRLMQVMENRTYA